MTGPQSVNAKRAGCEDNRNTDGCYPRGAPIFVFRELTSGELLYLSQKKLSWGKKNESTPKTDERSHGPIGNNTTKKKKKKKKSDDFRLRSSVLHEKNSSAQTVLLMPLPFTTPYTPHRPPEAARPPRQEGTCSREKNGALD